MALSRRTIRPSPARRIFSKIDTGQRSLNILPDHRRRPDPTAAARAGQPARSVRSGQAFPLRANATTARRGRSWPAPAINEDRKSGDGRIALMDPIDAGPVRLARRHADDVADIQAACDDPLGQRFLPLLPSPYTDADGRTFALEDRRRRGRGRRPNLAIADAGHRPADRRHRGHRARQDDRGEIGYWVAPWARGRRRRDRRRPGASPTRRSPTASNACSCAPSGRTGPASGWRSRPATPGRASSAGRRLPRTGGGTT